MPAFQFNVAVDGLALLTQGQLLEWDAPSHAFISPLGLMTRGLLIGLGDQWQYSDSPEEICWESDDTADNLVYGFAATLLAIPPTAASALLISPITNQVSLWLKQFSGGSLELFHAPDSTKVSQPLTDGVSLGAGYLVQEGERIDSEIQKFYLAATGSTAYAYLLLGTTRSPIADPYWEVSDI